MSRRLRLFRDDSIAAPAVAASDGGAAAAAVRAAVRPRRRRGRLRRRRPPFANARPTTDPFARFETPRRARRRRGVRRCWRDAPPRARPPASADSSPMFNAPCNRRNLAVSARATAPRASRRPRDDSPRDGSPPIVPPCASDATVGVAVPPAFAPPARRVPRVSAAESATPLALVVQLGVEVARACDANQRLATARARRAS